MFLMNFNLWLFRAAVQQLAAGRASRALRTRCEFDYDGTPCPSQNSSSPHLRRLARWSWHCPRHLPGSPWRLIQFAVRRSDFAFVVALHGEVEIVAVGVRAARLGEGAIGRALDRALAAVVADAFGDLSETDGWFQFFLLPSFPSLEVLKYLPSSSRSNA